MSTIFLKRHIRAVIEKDFPNGATFTVTDILSRLPLVKSKPSKLEIAQCLKGMAYPVGWSVISYSNGNSKIRTYRAIE